MFVRDSVQSKCYKICNRQAQTVTFKSVIIRHAEHCPVDLGVFADCFDSEMRVASKAVLRCGLLQALSRARLDAAGCADSRLGMWSVRIIRDGPHNSMQRIQLSNNCFDPANTGRTTFFLQNFEGSELCEVASVAHVGSAA